METDKQLEEKPVPLEKSIENPTLDIEKINEYFDLLNMIVGTKDEEDPGLDILLTKVLQRHEGDFFNAFNTHISKVKRELEYLKDKGTNQCRLK